MKIPANPLFSVMIDVGQYPELVAPVPVCAVRSLITTVENDVVAVRRTSPTVTI